MDLDQYWMSSRTSFKMHTFERGSVSEHFWNGSQA